MFEKNIRYFCIIFVAVFFMITKVNYIEAATTHYSDISIEKYPTKDEEGVRKYINAETGEVTYQIIPATGHRWSDWVVDIKPTYNNEGHKYRICTKYPDRPHIQEAIIPKLSKIDNYGGYSNYNEYNKKEVKKEEENHNNLKTDEKVVVKQDIVKDSAVKLEKKNDTKKINGDKKQSKQYEKSKNINENNISRELNVSTNKQLNKNIDKNINKVVDKKQIKNKSKNLFNKLFLAPVNVYDAVSVATGGTVLIFYIIVLWPMIAVLIWIDKKKKEKKDK